MNAIATGPLRTGCYLFCPDCEGLLLLGSKEKVFPGRILVCPLCRHVLRYDGADWRYLPLNAWFTLTEDERAAVISTLSLLEKEAAPQGSVSDGHGPDLPVHAEPRYDQ